MEYKLRLATLEDVPALRELIARSIHGLGAADYTPAQIEAALQGAFGVDTVLIRDGTYFVAETPTRDIVACGGWGRRRTLFGSDARAERDESWLNPKTDAAKIRAFFVDPAHARHGIGRAILARSEAEAIRAGFSSLDTSRAQRLTIRCQAGSQSAWYRCKKGFTRRRARDVVGLTRNRVPDTPKCA